MRVRSRRGPRVRLQSPPGGASVQRNLDSVAGDRRTSVVVRGRPVEVDLGRSARRRLEVRGRSGNGGVGGGVGDTRDRAGSRHVDRRHPVVPRAAGQEAGMDMVGGEGVRVEVQVRPGRSAVRGDLDSVAGNRGTPVVGGRDPREVDLQRSGSGGGQVGRCIRRAGGGGRIVHIRCRAISYSVDGRHPVVQRGIRHETRVTVLRIVGVRVGLQHRPTRGARVRNFDPVSGNRRAVVVCRRGPRQIDLGHADRRGPQSLRRAGDVGSGGGAVHIGCGAHSHRVDRTHLVVSGRARREAGVGPMGKRPDLPQCRPGDARVHRILDPIACDVGTAIEGGLIPIQVDPRRPGGCGRQVSRSVGDPGGGGGAGEVGSRTSANRVDCKYPIVPGGSGREEFVRIEFARQRIREQLPVDLIQRALDPIPDDRGSTVGVGRVPCQIDLMRSVGCGGQVPRSLRDVQCRRAVRSGPRSGSGHVHSGDPIVAGHALTQAGVGIDRGIRAYTIQPVPRASVGRVLDPVAGNRGAAIVARRGPREVDLVCTLCGGGQPGRAAGRGRGGHGGDRTGEVGALAHGVEGIDAVVAGGRRIQAGVGVVRTGGGIRG